MPTYPHPLPDAPLIGAPIRGVIENGPAIGVCSGDAVARIRLVIRLSIAINIVSRTPRSANDQHPL
jgi:hypothetical protein